MSREPAVPTGPPVCVATWPCTEPAWTVTGTAPGRSAGTSVLEHLAHRLLQAARARRADRTLVWLDSAGPRHDPDAESVLTAFPVAARRIQTDADPAEVVGLLDGLAPHTADTRAVPEGPTGTAVAHGDTARYDGGAPGAPLFRGGWLGMLGYEAAAGLEPVTLSAHRDLPVPLATWGLHPVWFRHDRAANRLELWSRIGRDLDTEPVDEAGRPLPALGAWFHWAEDAIRAPYDHTTPMWAPPEALRHVEPATRSDAEALLADAARSFDADGFADAVRAVQRAIREGEVFQANLAHRFALSSDADPFAVYIRLRRLNPSPFGAFLEESWGAVVSNSPERLVSVRRTAEGGRSVEARPIAGTRPRGADAEEDAAHTRALLGSAKERAEHTMLVDLARNDLGRVAVPGSVRVTDFHRVERYSHVLHLVSDVSAKVRPGTRVSELVRAAFPGGTITGAPKLRSIEVIDGIEPVQRGPYTGSLGYVNDDGTLDLNILIRTLVMVPGTAYAYAGAGIVADSDPLHEHEETRHKAAAMLIALATARQEATSA